jgi:hypothetical protein
MQKMGYAASPTATNLTSLIPDAFFDKKEGRYVISWSSTYYNPVGPSDGPRAPLFMCVSATDNALGTWTCWALDSVVAPLPFVELCPDRPTWDYSGDTIKVRGQQQQQQQQWHLRLYSAVGVRGRMCVKVCW